MVDSSKRFLISLAGFPADTLIWGRLPASEAGKAEAGAASGHGDLAASTGDGHPEAAGWSLSGRVAVPGAPVEISVTAPPGKTFLQRTASYDNIGSSSLTMLRKRLLREGEQVLLRANALLARRDRDRRASAPGGRRTRVTFGVYCLDEEVGDRIKAR